MILEIDEYQHKSYGVSCDVERMAKIVESFRLNGNTLRIVFIRYNPHSVRIDGEKVTILQKERHDKLVELLQELEREPVEDLCDLRT